MGTCQVGKCKPTIWPLATCSLSSDRALLERRIASGLLDERQFGTSDCPEVTTTNYRRALRELETPWSWPKALRLRELKVGSFQCPLIPMAGCSWGRIEPTYTEVFKADLRMRIYRACEYVGLIFLSFLKCIFPHENCHCIKYN